MVVLAVARAPGAQVGETPVSFDSLDSVRSVYLKALSPVMA